MKASVPCLAAWLLLTGCMGEIGEGTLDTPRRDSPLPQRDGGPLRRDAGTMSVGEEVKDDRRPDARVPDARAPESPAPLEPPAARPPAAALELPDAGSPSTPVDAGPTTGCGVTRDVSLALGLRVREVALYQTVKVKLFKNGAWEQSEEVPIVQGKRALVRVFVDTLPGYRPHGVRAVLRVQNGDTASELTQEGALPSSSVEGLLESTFTFDVPGTQIGSAPSLSVRLEELRCGPESGSPEHTRVPVEGAQALRTLAVGKLRVTVVPVRVDGRLPVTNEKELGNIKAALLAYYPVPDVELSVRQPLTWEGSVGAFEGESWSDVLNGIVGVRRADMVDDDVYYFGLIQPGATHAAYCRRGCQLGLAPLTTPVTPSHQVALGASFIDAPTETYETIVHELGHAHGRSHSPCVENGEIIGVDQDFPDPSGITGSWGWDSRSRSLVEPSAKDIMGYCKPNWISAYTYRALAERSSAVNPKALFRAAPSLRWHQVLLYASGRARWGSALETSAPGGSVELAEVLDSQGRRIDQVEVVRVALSHNADQFLYLPDPGPNWAALVLRDRTLVLGAVEPATRVLRPDL